jgi:hypothetical protein
MLSIDRNLVMEALREEERVKVEGAKALLCP